LADAHAGAEKQVKVLIVDDNVAYAQNIAEILELKGFVTVVFENAEEALPRATTSEVSVVITDYRLPGMNGVELVRRVRRERPLVSAVVISAYADDRVVDDAKALGVEFLPKPVDFAALDRIVAGPSGTA
jgi:DNA-binding NtrC family response regulator